MKKTPLNRLAPLKRKTPLKQYAMKSSWMRAEDRLEKERAERRLQYRRKKYRLRFNYCVCCDERPPRDVHEIRGGEWRHITVWMPCFWLPVCRDCHNEIHQTDKWPWARQLLMKKLKDSSTFSLELYNATLVGEVPISLGDMAAWAA